MNVLVKYIFIFISTVVFAQNTTVLYKLKNTCYNVALSPVIDKKYYKEHTLFVKDSSEYGNKGKFNLNVDHKFPLPYSFICNQKDGNFKMSALFVVSKENLNFELDSISNFKQPLPLKIKNSALTRDQYKFNLNFSDLLNVFINTEEETLKLDRLLIKYAKENPDSYMLFWTLVNQFQYKGGREAYLKSFNNLSAKIRSSEYGKIFYNELIASFKLSEKSQFPGLEFQNESILSSFGGKYTLINFWFSYCKPCLDEIPVYKRLYAKYKEDGFEIVNISTDRTEDIKNWRSTIRQKGLRWPQYLDENGVKSKFYNINKFPTTFLLDAKGKIIKKDISLNDLERFLEETLNKED